MRHGINNPRHTRTRKAHAATGLACRGSRARALVSSSGILPISLSLIGLGGVAMRDRLLKLGVIGSVVSALCCFTPVLVWLLAGLGLASLVGALDVVLFPALVIFVFITGYAVWRRRKPT